MDGVLRTEKAVLLGLIALLGTTGTLPGAVTGTAVAALAGLGVWLVGSLVKEDDKTSRWIRWIVLGTTGFAIAWLAAGLADLIMPLTAQQLLHIRLIGVLPIVYYSCAKNIQVRPLVFTWLDFAAVMLITGFVRELAGKGTVWSNLPPWGWAIPADFMAAPFGAFLVPAVLILAVRIVHSVRASGVQKEAA